MAEDVTPPPAASEPEPEITLLPNRSERARQSSYRFRFGIIYIVLAALVGAGLGAFAILVVRDAPPEAAQWSAWKPDGSLEASAKQIADHVSKSYRLPSGNQLAVALVGPPEVQDVKVRAIAVRPDTSTGQAEEDDVDVIDDGRVDHVHPLRARRAVLDQGGQGDRGPSPAPPPRGARALALLVQVPGRRRLGGRLPAAAAERGDARSARRCS